MIDRLTLNEPNPHFQSMLFLLLVVTKIRANALFSYLLPNHLCHEGHTARVTKQAEGPKAGWKGGLNF